MRDFGGMGGFESIFGGGRSRSDERRGQDIRVTVRLTLTEVALGVKKTVKIKSLERCTVCEGSGAKAGTKPTPCTSCGGSGEVRRAARSMFGQFISVAACPTCNGEGTVVLEPCEVCRGEGRVRGERTVTVDIPAGVSSNNYLTLRGQGAAGPRGGPSGDLLVMLDIKDDDRFERQGDDLIFDLPLSFSQAALGGEHEVPDALWRGAPQDAGRHPDRRRCSGSGTRVFPVLGQDGKGDLLVRVHVWTPERLTAEQERLFRELAKLEGEPPKRVARILVQAQGSAGRMSWWAIDVRPAAEQRDRMTAWLVARTGHAVEERDDGTLVSFAPDEASAEALVDAAGARGRPIGRDPAAAAGAGRLVNPLARWPGPPAVWKAHRGSLLASRSRCTLTNTPSCSIPRARSAVGSTAPPAPR